MVDCVQHIPCRARFKLAALRKDVVLAETIRREVAAIPGVASVELNRHAASIIVHYCTERGDLSRIMDHICVHCPKSAANRRPTAPKPAPIAVTVGPRPMARISPQVTCAMGEAVSKAVLNTFFKDTVERGLTRIFLGLR